MCLDGCEMYGTKERLVDHHYEFVTHPIVEIGVQFPPFVSFL